MRSHKKIFQASPNVFEYITISFLFLITVFGYFIGLHYMVIIVLGLITLIRATEMNYHILVFDDRFIIRYSNFLGKMMTVDSVFYFKEVIKFDFHIHNQTQNAGQTLVVSIATKLRTNRYNRSKNEMPLAEINIEYLDDLRESKIKKFSFHYSGRSYEKAFKLIKSKI